MYIQYIYYTKEINSCIYNPLGNYGLGVGTWDLHLIVTTQPL